MQFTFLVVISFFLLCLLIPAHSTLIRAPISKLPRQRKNATSTIRNLATFSGSMSIEDSLDSQYGATIQVGSNNQAFTFVLDTGSCNMWIPGASYVGSTGNYFDCASSSTCISTRTPLDLDYGSGAVYGYEIEDQIQLGDLTIPQFPISLVYEAEGMEGNQFDGLIGLALGRNPQNNLPTVLETLKQYNLISVGMFSMYLGYDPTSNLATTGEIIFGGYDPQYAVSEFQFVNVSTSSDVSYWLTEMSVGYGKDQNLSSKLQPVIFDSGTSLILLSETIFEDLLDAASEVCEYDDYAGTAICDCSAKDTLEDLVFYFENATLNISASQYISKIDGECTLAISIMEGEITDKNPMILGDTFLSNYYALYTADNYTVGLAQARPATPSSSNSSPNSSPNLNSTFSAWLMVLIVLASIMS